MTQSSRTIYMLVYNHFEYDSRVQKEALTLASIGYSVHVIAVWKQGLPRVETMNSITVHRLGNPAFYIKLIGQKNFYRFKKIIYGSLTPAAEDGEHLEFKLHQKKRHGGFKFFFSTLKKIIWLHFFYRGIRSFFYKKAISHHNAIFHSHDLNTLYIGYKMAKKYHAKLVYDSHELYVYRNRPYFPPEWFLKLEEKFERRYIRKSDAVITVSQSIGDHLEQTYDIDKPYLIMNAPYRNASNVKNQHVLREALEIDEKKKILLYAGKITFGRGLDKVIESLLDLENIFFVMMGDGDEEFKRYINWIVEKVGVKDRVAFFGPVPSEEVTAYAASADIGIAPIENVCLSYYYCAPNKVFEYIQGGLPVVASDFPDLKRIVEENGIGVTCDISKPEEIARTLNQVLWDYSLYLKQVHKIKNRYCWEMEALKLEKVYTNLYGEK